MKLITIAESGVSDTDGCAVEEFRCYTMRQPFESRLEKVLRAIL